MIQHLRHHVWTVLKRNVLCQASATFTHLQDKNKTKHKRLFQRMFLFQRPFECRKNKTGFGLGKKGIVALIVTPTSASSIYDIYIKPLWLKSSSRFTCKWI